MTGQGIAPEEARLNAKYGAFWVMRFSRSRGRYIGIGKPCPTIRQALNKANKLEKTGRYEPFMLFVDVKP